jgi:hypothetical protein
LFRSNFSSPDMYVLSRWFCLQSQPLPAHSKIATPHLSPAHLNRSGVATTP